jgi:hypothetical protein
MISSNDVWIDAPAIKIRFAPPAIDERTVILTENDFKAGLVVTATGLDRGFSNCRLHSISIPLSACPAGCRARYALVGDSFVITVMDEDADVCIDLDDCDMLVAVDLNEKNELYAVTIRNASKLLSGCTDLKGTFEIAPRKSVESVAPPSTSSNGSAHKAATHSALSTSTSDTSTSTRGPSSRKHHATPHESTIDADVMMAMAQKQLGGEFLERICVESPSLGATLVRVDAPRAPGPGTPRYRHAVVQHLAYVIFDSSGDHSRVTHSVIDVADAVRGGRILPFADDAAWFIALRERNRGTFATLDADPTPLYQHLLCHRATLKALGSYINLLFEYFLVHIAKCSRVVTRARAFDAAANVRTGDIDFLIEDVDGRWHGVELAIKMYVRPPSQHALVYDRRGIALDENLRELAAFVGPVWETRARARVCVCV